MLEQLTNDLEVWIFLVSRFGGDLFVGGFMNETNEGIDLSTDVLRMIADRRLRLGLDIYAPHDD